MAPRAPLAGFQRITFTIVTVSALVAVAAITFNTWLSYTERLQHTRLMVMAAVHSGMSESYMQLATSGHPPGAAELAELGSSHLRLPHVSAFVAPLLPVPASAQPADPDARAAIAGFKPEEFHSFTSRGGWELYPFRFENRAPPMVAGFRRADVMQAILPTTLYTTLFVAAGLLLYYQLVFRRVRQSLEQPLQHFLERRLSGNIESIVLGSPQNSAPDRLDFITGELKEKVEQSLELLDRWARHKANLDRLISLSIMEVSRTDLVRNLHQILTAEFPLRAFAMLTANASQNRLEALWATHDGHCPEQLFSEPGQCFVYRTGSKLIQGSEMQICAICPSAGSEVTLCKPLVASSKLIGVCKLRLDSAILTREWGFVPEHQPRLNVVDAFLSPYIDLAALGLSNIALLDAYKNQALTDALTGLYNRRYIIEYMTSLLSVARRSGSPVAVLMIDVDDFKRLNDEYGHKTGDIVLRVIASNMRRALREGDVIARYGGEEFIVVLPGSDSQVGAEVAERVRQAVAEIEWDQQQLSHLPRVTISIGVANFPLHGYSHYHLSNAADKALYRAKRNGKNQVQVHEVVPAEGGQP